MREKCINTTQQVGDSGGWFFGAGWSRRRAEDANRRGARVAQFLPELLKGCGQHLSVDLPMNGIHMAEVSWRKHNSLLVQKLRGGDRGVCRGEKHCLGESGMYEVCHERGAIPAGECEAAKINEVDFDSFFLDVLCQAGEKRFLCLLLIKRGVDEIDAQDTDGFLLKDIRGIPQVNVQQNLVGRAARLQLKPQTNPAMGVVGSGVVAR